MDNIYTNPWSPFDPEWYEEVFDKYLSTAAFKDRQQAILDTGYILPDADGSKSSLFANEAKLNNTFNEEAVIETLKETYNNSSHILKARNHDNVHFYKWQGFMADMILEENTYTAEFTIYTNAIIPQKHRRKFKESGLFGKWLTIEDIMNNWDVFGWNLMLFIDNRIYSEYTFRIDDHETIINFKYYPFWITQNYHVGLYKFDTNYQQRVLISSELCNNQWNWKMPVSYIDLTKFNTDKLMVAFNKLQDDEYRTDDNTAVHVLGENLEFVNVVDGYIDLTNISNVNKILIMSETKQYLWMSIMVPKFFHEYPILLPVDSVYRSYMPDLREVISFNESVIEHMHAYTSDMDPNQLYVDIGDNSNVNGGEWVQLIRPIVFTDAYENPNADPYESMKDDIQTLRDLAVKAADVNLEFRMYITTGNITDAVFQEHVVSMKTAFEDLYDAYNAILYSKRITIDTEYSGMYNDSFLPMMSDIEIKMETSSYLSDSKFESNTLWNITSPLIYNAEYLADRFYSSILIMEMGNTNLWEDPDKYKGLIRFQRPIDVSDFWIFEYNHDKASWEPTSITVEHRFPDVYLLSDPTGAEFSDRRIFKAFFFYSDTMTVLDETRDLIAPDPQWDSVVNEYYVDSNAFHRDIFMEKFYWMAISMIYSGAISTDCRWELLEYIIDNESYDKFNNLFLHTTDPYFKYGLTSYFNGDNFEFPFDEVIDKLNESFNLDWNGFMKVANYTRYLQKSWTPSFFDNVLTIDDKWTPDESSIVYRPNSTFDITRVIPAIEYVHNDMETAYAEIKLKLDEILEQIRIEPYNLNVANIELLNTQIISFRDYFTNDVLRFIEELDIDVFTLADLNYLIESVSRYADFTRSMREFIENIHADVNDNLIYDIKQNMIDIIRSTLLDRLREGLYAVFTTIELFDLETFMSTINNLSTFSDHNKDNDDDNSLMYYFNQFNDDWTVEIKSYRDDLFASTILLAGMFDSTKSYSDDEVQAFIDTVNSVYDDLNNLKTSIYRFWDIRGITYDETLVTKIEDSELIISKFHASIGDYEAARDNLVEICNLIRAQLKDADEDKIGETETSWIVIINGLLDDMIADVSYMAGTPDRDAAEGHLTMLSNIIDEWDDPFLIIEERIFTLLLDITGEPNVFLETIESNQSLLDALIDYIELINREYQSDLSLPTYADVYEVDEIELIAGGFWYEIGDIIFVPNLGAYVVTTITSDIGIATSIEEDGYRKSTFRNPMVQTQSYFTSANGKGMGISITPKTVTHEYIISNDVVERIVSRISSASRAITQCLSTHNSSDNDNYNTILTNIKSISSDWESLIVKAENYISSELITHVSGIIDISLTLSEPSMAYINGRSAILYTDILSSIESFITNLFSYLTANDSLTDEYYTLNTEAKTIYVSLLRVVNNGWTDTVVLRPYVEDCLNIPSIYRSQNISKLIDDDTWAMFNEALSSITSCINNTLEAIDLIESYIPPIESIISNLNDMISTVDYNTTSSEWYQFTKCNPSLVGSGYKAGDIVEIIPSVADTQIASETIIMNDKILLQVMEVDKDRVMSVQPLLNYALPYAIYGPRETITKSGSGSGLWVDTETSIITSTDNTIFDSENSYVGSTDQYDDSDNFVFRFINNNSLNISYEVYLGGIQTTSFFKRHDDSENENAPNTKQDYIYINANNVMDLKDSIVYVAGENYFIYKINGIELKDVGAGYCVGQQLYVDIGTETLRLTVNGIIDTDPFKGISTIALTDGNTITSEDDIYVMNVTVVSDGMNNIDDEYSVTDYDELTSEGIVKPLTLSYDETLYHFTSIRHDNLADGYRNKHFLYPEVTDDNAGDYRIIYHDDVYYLMGTRIDNELAGMKDDVWNGIVNLQPPTDPFIPDKLRQPELSSNDEAKADWQLVSRVHLHNSSDTDKIEYDLVVNTEGDLPVNTDDYPDGSIGKQILVKTDTTMHMHQTVYTIRTFIANGNFVYGDPEYADDSWNIIEVNWLTDNPKDNYPTMKMCYPDAPWRGDNTYAKIVGNINDGMYDNQILIDEENNGTYMHKVSRRDLSVFNWTLKQWEDLTDVTRWNLEIYETDSWGFKLTFLPTGEYSYDMKVYLHKSPDAQARNAELVKSAELDISTSLSEEVNTEGTAYSVNTFRDLTIRKLFPYEFYQTFTVGKSSTGEYNYEMDVALPKYYHFHNRIYLEDIKMFNITANRYEDLLDRTLFEVRFKDDDNTGRGIETQTSMADSFISKPGSGFIDGYVWGWNEDLQIHLFGTVTAVTTDERYITTFTPTHCPNPPDFNISLEFKVYQSDTHTESQMALIVVQFETKEVELYQDGYIHNVNNALSVVPEQFKIISQYDLDSEYQYEVRIDKTQKSWRFVETEWISSPVFRLEDVNIPANRLYLLTDKGRFPLVNPESGYPTMSVTECASCTEVQFLNIYKMYEVIEIMSLPYPIRSVYTQRIIPSNGYIDLKGKLNKPLDKRYYEFWVNGRLLNKEVNIVTPTKMFLHGLTSLKNLEIIEINRDPNEYFADAFLRHEINDYGRDSHYWDFTTYLDKVLEYALDGDNYTEDEQAALLYPIWPQVSADDPNYRDYSVNVDTDDDVLERLNAETDGPAIEGLDDVVYESLMINTPSIESVELTGNSLQWEQMGWEPITDERIIELLNEEWADEILDNPDLGDHVILSEEEWYGKTAKLYDAYGIRVHNLNDAVYSVSDFNWLQINSKTKINKIVPTSVTYDLD